ncbi:MAG TPA: PRC-barrel domain-containing protein [Chloroflexota bacterium]|nr:PRC-barrel domain-containing protein [Chloroflexota bacterium]
MNIDQLQGMAVVSVHQAEKLGTIEDVLLDLDQHRVGGLLLHGGPFRGGPVVGWASVRSIGQDAVMVDDSNAAGSGSEGQVSGLTRTQELRGMKVVTDTGALAGTIEGADIDPATGQITRYMVAEPGGGLFHQGHRFTLAPEAIVGIGVDLITVRAGAITVQRDETGES